MTVTPSTGARRSSGKPMLVTLIAASAVSPLAINIFIPSMASIADDLATDNATVGLGLSLYLVATALIQLVAGPLSDRFGRRPVINGGMVLFLLGTALCLAATDIGMFLAGRVVQAASATGLALSRAIVRDIYSRERAASMIGYVTMGLAVAPMIGPAIGGVIDTAIGWRAVFWLLAGCGVLTLALLHFDLAETNQERGRPILSQFRSYRSLFATPALWGYIGASSLTSGVFFSFLGGAPFIAVEVLGMTSAGYGAWFMLCALGYMVGNFATARLSERVGLKPLIVAGSGLALTGALFTAIAAAAGSLTTFTLFAPMLIVGAGSGLTLPSATAGGVSVRPDAAGAAAGFLGAFQIGTGAVLSFVAALLATSNAGGIQLTLLMVASALGGLLCGLRVPRMRA